MKYLINLLLINLITLFHGSCKVKVGKTGFDDETSSEDNICIHAVRYVLTDKFLNRCGRRDKDISSIMRPQNNNPVYHSLWKPAYRVIYNMLINRDLWIMN